MSLSSIKSRVASNLYDRTLSLNYGIRNCSADYSDEQLQDDLIYIDLISSRRDCSHLAVPPVKRLNHIIFGIHTPSPVNTCN